MSKIHGMMDIGKRSMQNSQTALQTVGHNIANRSTEGFSRQRVEIQSAEAVGQGKLRVGTGSKTANITRINNPYLEKQIGKERASLGYYKGVSDGMARVEQVYNEQSTRGLSAFVGDFFNTFREFANNPESLATRTQVRETADHLTKDFKRMDRHLKEIQKDLDQQIVTDVEEINGYVREIANLNEKVSMVQLQGGPANDERDRRDLLVKKLGEKVNIRWAEGEDGMVTITAGNSALMVAGYDAKTLEVRSTPGSETKGEGNVDIFYINTSHSEPQRVTEQFTGGSVGGLLEVRDKKIGELLRNNNEMAFGLATTVNEVHSRGFDGYNQRAGDFFQVGDSLQHAAENIDIASAIQNDAGKIAAAAQANSPADNRIANSISKLQYEGIMNEGSATLDEFYNSMVGQVGISTRKAGTAQQSQKDVLTQLNNIRDSVSGVSLDEETTKLIEFQKAFDASARLIRTADEMFDTVLNLKRM